jgi:uncharacterized protein YceK
MSLSKFKGHVLKLLIAAVFILGGCATVSSKQAPVPSKKTNSPISETDDIEEKWGAQLKGIRLSAAGYMLDFRYRITDTDKALPLFERKTKPYLIDQASGAKFVVPAPAKTGPLRNSNNPLADRTYFMFFANPGRYIKQGDKVTVVIGDFKAKDLIVE